MEYEKSYADKKPYTKPEVVQLVEIKVLDKLLLISTALVVCNLLVLIAQLVWIFYP